MILELFNRNWLDHSTHMGANEYEIDICGIW